MLKYTFCRVKYMNVHREDCGGHGWRVERPQPSASGGRFDEQPDKRQQENAPTVKEAPQNQSCSFFFKCPTGGGGLGVNCFLGNVRNTAELVLWASLSVTVKKRFYDFLNNIHIEDSTSKGKSFYLHVTLKSALRPILPSVSVWGVDGWLGKIKL